MCICIDSATLNFLDRSRAEFLKKFSTWTFTSAEQLEKSEKRIRRFATCTTKQEFVTTRLRNPGVEDVEIRINTVSCGDHSADKPTLGAWEGVCDGGGGGGGGGECGQTNPRSLGGRKNHCSTNRHFIALFVVLHRAITELVRKPKANSPHGKILTTRACLNPVVVIAHGFANAWGNWVCCLGPLSKQFNVIAIDWVGNGR